MGESKSSPRRITARERQKQALELRKWGATFEAIAQQLGYKSRQAAAYSVEAALKRITQRPAEEVKKLDIERLDMMLLALMSRIRVGDTFAINTALAIMARRSKLLGLDMPIEHRIEVTDERDLSKIPQGDLDALLAEAERILDNSTA